jgi:prolyl-tRNA editing enzyme YbaK/EbsC (Cys-tRNA(Pro) deacylase)
VTQQQVHPNVARVVAAGRELSLEIEPFHFPDGTKTAADAAAAIGVEVGQIVKSLIFAVDGDVGERSERTASRASASEPGGDGVRGRSPRSRLVVAYVSGSNQLDERKLAAAAGGTTCTRVDADTVRTATGFPIGGVPPFGHATGLPVFVDPDLLQHDVVWAAAGTWNDVFAISPDDLVRASGGTVTELRRS